MDPLATPDRRLRVCNSVHPERSFGTGLDHIQKMTTAAGMTVHGSRMQARRGKMRYAGNASAISG
jgi:hypothetical protein